MPVPPRLYERAAPGQALGPLWFLDEGRTFFAGPLTYNAPHQHGAPVFLAGLYGPFGLRIAGGCWQSCRTALVPAGVVHELDVGGEPIAVFYLEPSVDGAHALAPLVANAREEQGALFGRGSVLPLLRDMWEAPDSATWAGEALSDVVDVSRRRARVGLDPRIARVAAAMNDGDGVPELAVLARTVGLSPSRLQHLFTAEVGVPFRRYRAWGRMRRAISEIAAGSSFTAAAHGAGFADQAHFTHDFRRTFGAAPSQSLRGVRL
ncbi:helix-turn-helix transcriptional regulator [Xanthobacter sp. KR7-65]|uniref:helix-turn-helix domain-containing protein n=1 Tax=Xanthobacter sp. KR7-65 TaxID=3156612 RepID=UPI0032B3E205